MAFPLDIVLPSRGGQNQATSASGTRAHTDATAVGGGGRPVSSAAEAMSQAGGVQQAELQYQQRLEEDCGTRLKEVIRKYVRD